MIANIKPVNSEKSNSEVSDAILATLGVKPNDSEIVIRNSDELKSYTEFLNALGVKFTIEYLN